MAKKKNQNPVGALYVASDLEFWITDELHIWADKVTINNKQFVKLTPDVIAWFKGQIAQGERACNNGKISPDEYLRVVRAFCPVYEFAVRTGMIPDPVKRAKDDEQADSTGNGLAAPSHGNGRMRCEKA